MQRIVIPALGFWLVARRANRDADAQKVHPARKPVLWWLGLGLLAIAALGLPRGASAAASRWIGDEHAAARLVAAVRATGSSATIDGGLEIRMAPGWHAYWRDPGDAGLPPTIDWTGSTNLAHADIAWPAPTRLSIQGLETYVYPDHVLLPVAITLAEPGHPLELRAAVDYAACAEVCVPYHADLTLALPAGLALPDDEAPLIAAARARVPGSLEATGFTLLGVTVAPAGRQDAVLTLRLGTAGATFRRPDLFIEGLGHGQAGRPEVRLADGGRSAIITEPVAGNTAAALTGTPLTFTITDGPERAAEFAAAPNLGTTGATTSALAILGVALLGGLILNLMPCVLPVLSLKLLALAGLAGAHRRAARFSLLATAAGVLASFALLAGALIVLRSAGTTIGWGIQFQQPWFLAGMAVITAMFAASLWGWFNIDLPRGIYAVAGSGARAPLTNAFLTGAFATLLATPCSAPFVGTAVGFALSRGPAEIAWIFTALGVGLASPYLLVAAVPAALGLLPRPGHWMLRLRQVLALLLVGTAGWLITILAREAGMLAAVVSGCLIVAGLALIAWRARPVVARRRTMAATAAALLSAGAIVIPELMPQPAPVAPLASAQQWRPFDTAEIARQVAAGHLVFVDVTAAWCLTCKVNAALVLDREPVAGRLRGADVVAMRADWTRPDPAITRYLESFGRFGVPLDVVYGPGRPDGIALPELLTTSIVIEALDNAGTSAVASRAGALEK